jgi:hypothetical protein
MSTSSPRAVPRPSPRRPRRRRRLRRRHKHLYSLRTPQSLSASLCLVSLRQSRFMTRFLFCFGFPLAFLLLAQSIFGTVRKSCDTWSDATRGGWCHISLCISSTIASSVQPSCTPRSFFVVVLAGAETHLSHRRRLVMKIIFPHLPAITGLHVFDRLAFAGSGGSTAFGYPALRSTKVGLPRFCLAPKEMAALYVSDTNTQWAVDRGAPL